MHEMKNTKKPRVKSFTYLVTSVEINKHVISDEKSEYLIYPINKHRDLENIITSGPIVKRMWIIRMYPDCPKGTLTARPIHRIERCRSKKTGEDLGLSCVSKDFGRELEFGEEISKDDAIEVAYTVACFD